MAQIIIISVLLTLNLFLLVFIFFKLVRIERRQVFIGGISLNILNIAGLMAVRDLQGEMLDAADNDEFERAQDLKNTISQIDKMIKSYNE